jgi:lipopolysaccharide/colanic/teichoic acid biosynthesis glycosyltransferase
MSEQEIQKLVLLRLAHVQNPLGLWRLNFYAHWKGLCWRWVIASAVLIKRIFDIIGSLLLLIAFSPLFAFLAVLIKLEDRGPVLFTQVRVGKWGREFKMYKFRSMCLHAETRLVEVLDQNEHKENVTFKMKNDPRITCVGRWMRRFSLDELPQFFNVLLGDMSLVGPRPPLPREVALYSPTDRRRLAVMPGITCLWQIGGRSEIDFSGQVQLDVRYIESQCFLTDLKILLATIPAVLSGRGAC